MNRSSRLLLLLLAASIAWCGTPHPTTAEIRLITPLTSYGSAPGSLFRAVVIAPYQVGDRVLLPPGTLIEGSIRRRKAVGVGLVHERARLELNFTAYELPDGRSLPLSARLSRIENARETVTPAGEIRGILAAESPQSFVDGVWFVPKLEQFQRSFIGLTGASGRIWTAYSMGPLGAAGLFVARCALFRLPEPEIRLPAGTEMRIAVTQLPDDAPSFASPQPGEIPEELADWLARQQFSITKPTGLLARDIINVAFIASAEQLASAFSAAGWSQAEALTPRSFSRAYKAYTAQSGYAAAPASKLLYDGAEPDFIFQKSLNTISKRHHVRIWRAQVAGQEIWLGAATHDIGIEFSAGAITHRIHPKLDAERRKIVDDLAFAGCSAPAAFVSRPAAARGPDLASGIVTDGRLAVLPLHDCAGPQVSAASADIAAVKPPMTRTARMARRMVLEGRQYVLRGNIYYWGYRAIRWRHSRQTSAASLDE